MPTDRRHDSRRILNWACVISTTGGALVSQCTVRDISTTGAMIAMDDPSQAPDQFILRLTRNGTIWRKCHTIWRAASNIGVTFAPNHR